MPQDWNYGTDRLGGASMAIGSGWRGFERYGLLTSVVLRPEPDLQQSPVGAMTWG